MFNLLKQPPPFVVEEGLNFPPRNFSDISALPSHATLLLVMDSRSEQEKEPGSVRTQPSQQVCLNGTPEFQNFLRLMGYVQKFAPSSGPLKL